VAPGWTAKAVLAAPAVLAPAGWWVLERPARWLVVFFVAVLLLPPLPIAMGDSGPHPSLAMAAVGLFAGVLWLGRWRVAPTGVNGALVALWGVLLVSVALAAVHSGAEAAAGSLARVGLLGIAVYVFFYTACGPAAGMDGFRAARPLFWMAVVAALFACVDFYFQFPAPAGYGPQFVWLGSGVYRRAQGLFYEANTLGNFCAFFLVMTAVGLTRPPGEAPVSRLGMWAGGVALLAALMLSYSRGSVACLATAVAVLVWRIRRRVKWPRVLVALAAFAGGAGLVIWQVFPAFAEIYWMRLAGSAEFFFSATEGVLSGRVASWRTLVDWAAANPWLAIVGIGYKTLPYSDYLGGPVVADDMYLSLLVETGILGLGALLWLNVAILRAAGQAARAADPRRAFFGTWLVCFWAGQMVQMLTGDVLTYWRVLPVYFWALAMAVRA